MFVLVEQKTNNNKYEDKIMKQLVMDLSAGIIMAGFVSMMTIWMMVIGG